MRKQDKIEEVIIIGGGPAGLSAAIYLARTQRSPLVLASSPPGGQLMLTGEVENYPGFESVLGPDLVEKMRKQAKKFGARIIDENVLKVDFSKRPFKIFLSESTKFFSQVNSSSSQSSEPLVSLQKRSKKLADSNIHSQKKFISSLSIIIATGAKALWLGLESEQRLRGRGVSACATCDGFFFRDKTVAVVGGGDTAMEEALTLSKFAKKIYIIHRRGEFRASKIMQERVFGNQKIEVIWHSHVVEVLGKQKVEGVKLKIKNAVPAGRQEKLKILKLDGLFIAIGHKPDTEIFKGQINLDKKGYVVINSKYLTSVDGVFAAGDCVDYQYRQVGTAVGMGIAAALETDKWLEFYKSA